MIFLHPHQVTDDASPLRSALVNHSSTPSARERSRATSIACHGLIGEASVSASRSAVLLTHADPDAVQGRACLQRARCPAQFECLSESDRVGPAHGNRQAYPAGEGVKPIASRLAAGRTAELATGARRRQPEASNVGQLRERQRVDVTGRRDGHDLCSPDWPVGPQINRAWHAEAGLCMPRARGGSIRSDQRPKRFRGTTAQKRCVTSQARSLLVTAGETAPQFNSGERTDEALAREIAPVVGVARFLPGGARTTMGVHQAGMGSERSSLTRSGPRAESRALKPEQRLHGRRTACAAIFSSRDSAAVARLAHNQEVVGSIPTPATSSRGDSRLYGSSRARPETMQASRKALTLAGQRARRRLHNRTAGVAAGPREAFRRAA